MIVQHVIYNRMRYGKLVPDRCKVMQSKKVRFVDVKYIVGRYIYLDANVVVDE